MSFVHLHRHSEFSLLDGIGTNQQYAERAAQLGQPALALTDHGSLAGSLHHMNACRDAGVLPIVGCEMYFRPQRKVQGQAEMQYRYWHIVLLAKNAEGWKNLMRITADAWDIPGGFYRKPCCDLETLRQYHEGLICGTACLGGWLCQRVEGGDSTGADAWLRQLKSIFGEDLFVEIMPSHLDRQIAVNLELVGIANDHSVMLCATCDAHSPYAEWCDTQDVLLMTRTNQTLKTREEKRAKDEDVFEFNDPTYFLQSEAEVRENFASHHPGLRPCHVDESIRNTLEIASRCNPFLVGRNDKLPRIERERPDEEILCNLTYEGLKRHGTFDDPVYRERADYELEQITQAGIAPYILMVNDVIEWAMSDRGLPDKDGYEKPGEKIPFEIGPGRGSAGGSLVCDSVGITNLDPIAYRLLFERFYNVDRRGLPDIDVDFAREDIDMVEEYTRRKFGKNHVLDIIAHQTFGPRACIRKVGTALCLPFETINTACESIDEQDRSPLTEIRVSNHFVNEVAEEYPVAWEHMNRLQGQVMNRSEHPAALIVTPPDVPVQEALPVERIGGQTGKLITAWGERAGKGNTLISDYGFNKFDWLRVAELDKQKQAVRLIEKRTGEKVVLRDLPVHRDPYAVEPEVMEAFGKGMLTGVFQFSATAARLTRRMKPENIFDLAAINALIRPGPRNHGDDEEYVARKNGSRDVVYWHESAESLLDYSYGVLVFQEQLVQVVHELGGLTTLEADTFRKIASKLYRDPEYARSEMGKWCEPIKAGFMAAGITAEEFGQPTGGGNDGREPTGIWKNFLSFSDYSFNLAHAAGYALLAYRDMWLKVHYPAEFFAAFLSKGLAQKKEKRAEQKQSAAREARWFGLKLMPPDINESGYDYTVTDEGIRVGLGSIKHVGDVAVKEVLVKRPPGGYASYADLDARTEKRRCNIKVKGALVCAGAFDRFDQRLDYTAEKVDELEREYIGIGLTTQFSASSYADVIEPRITSEDVFETTLDDELVVVAGEVIGTKEWRDKNGGLMCFVDLAYGADVWNVTFFSHMYGTYRDLIHSHRPIIVRGRKNSYNGRASVIPLDPEQQGDSWIHYVQDVDDLAQLVRSEEPIPA